MSDPDRHIAPSKYLFAKNADFEEHLITKLEGQPESVGGKHIRVKQLVAGQDMVFMEARRDKGLVDPEHAHPDHESICYLVSGRMRVVIDGEEFVAEPGDAWLHPAGVPHFHETLEDSVQIEIKSPPRKTWS